MVQLIIQETRKIERITKQITRLTFINLFFITAGEEDEEGRRKILK